jgi:hypothetical protein
LPIYYGQNKFNFTYPYEAVAWFKLKAKRDDELTVRNVKLTFHYYEDFSTAALSQMPIHEKMKAIDPRRIAVDVSRPMS